jgi:hypothetical protein
MRCQMNAPDQHHGPNPRANADQDADESPLAEKGCALSDVGNFFKPKPLKHTFRKSTAQIGPLSPWRLCPPLPKGSAIGFMTVIPAPGSGMPRVASKEMRMLKRCQPCCAGSRSKTLAQLPICIRGASAICLWKKS